MPPTLRGARVRGMNPREVLAFQGWWVCGFWDRADAGATAPDDGGVVAAAAAARSAAACLSSLSRQQCLYLRPDPQWQGSLRPGDGVRTVIENSVPHDARSVFPWGA